jgi:ribonuclease P protein component
MVERDLRLRSEYDVRQARSRGKAHADGPLVLRILRNDTDPPKNRYAFVAGKRVGNAVARNRSKRLCREVIRHLHDRITPGYDVVLIVRGDRSELPSYAVAREVIERILTRCRLLAPVEE